jgi:hypothetical protein
MTNKDNDTISKLNPNYRKVKAIWWEKDAKVKKRPRRIAHKGIITLEKNRNKNPVILADNSYDMGLF